MCSYFEKVVLQVESYECMRILFQCYESQMFQFLNAISSIPPIYEIICLLFIYICSLLLFINLHEKC